MISAAFDHIYGYTTTDDIKTEATEDEEEDEDEEGNEQTDIPKHLLALQDDDQLAAEDSDPDWEPEIEFQNFNFSPPPGLKPGPVGEESLNPYEPVLPKDTEITYTLVKEASQRDADVLVDSLGYSYTWHIKGKGRKAGLWICSCRSKKLLCRSMLRKRNGKYVRVGRYHCHPPDPDSLQNYKLNSSIKCRIKEDPHQPLRILVTEELRKLLSEQGLADRTESAVGDGQEALGKKQRDKIQNLLKIAKRYVAKNYGFEPMVDLNPKPKPKVVENIYEPPLNSPREYDIIEGGSQRGESKLVDNLGYNYCLKKKSGTNKHWPCSVRHRKMQCHAAVVQKGSDFVRREKHPHNHPPEENAAYKFRINAELKAAFLNQAEKSCTEIAQEIYDREKLLNPDIVSSLSKVENAAKMGQRLRKNTPGMEPPPKEIEKNIYEPPLDQPRQYDIIEGCTLKGEPKLVDNLGYNYCQKRTTGKNQHWQCSVRCRSLTCKAVVIQKGPDHFKRQIHPHIHPADPNAAYKFKIFIELKAAFLKQPEKSCFSIVREIYEREKLLNPDIFPCLTKLEQAAKIGHRLRAKTPGMGTPPRQNVEYVNRINSEINSLIASQPNRQAMQIAREIYEREKMLNPNLVDSLPKLEWAAKRGRRLMHKANRANMAEQSEGQGEQSAEQGVVQNVEVMTEPTIVTEQAIQIVPYSTIVVEYDPQEDPNNQLQQLGQFYL